MPITPENRARYPRNWPAISARIRFERAAGRCECVDECGLHRGKCSGPVTVSGRAISISVGPAWPEGEVPGCGPWITV